MAELFHVNLQVQCLPCQKLQPVFTDTFKIVTKTTGSKVYRGADKSLARPTSRCILFHGENIYFDASLVIYIYIYIYIYIQQNLPKTERDRSGIFSVFTGFRFTKGCVLIKQGTKNMITKDYNEGII